MTTIGREAEKNQQNNVYQMQKTTKMKRLTRSTSSYKIFILAEICTATKWKYNKVHARFVCFDLNGPGWNGRGSHVSDIAIVIPGTWQHHFLSGVLIPPPPHFPLDLLCCPNSMLYFVFCFVLLFFFKSHFFWLSEFSDECQTFVPTLFYRRMHFVIVNHMYSMCFMNAVYKCTYIYILSVVYSYA